MQYVQYQSAVWSACYLHTLMSRWIKRGRKIILKKAVETLFVHRVALTKKQFVRSFANTVSYKLFDR